MSTFRELILPLINTVMLLCIFFYQKNRNKLLSDRILEQNALLKETSDVVSKQATAITSHGTIVDSAIKYSQCFDISRVEDIIRREVSIEKEQELIKIKEEYERQLSKSDDVDNINLGDQVESISKFAASVAQEMFKDIIVQYVSLLVNLPTSERDESIAAINDENARSMIKSLLDKIYTIIGATVLESGASQSACHE